MKHLFTLLAFGATTMASAQLVNGSFEQNGVPSLAGWDMDCTCSVPTVYTDVPGGTGDWSLRMNSTDAMNNCICFISGLNRQAVPWLTPGDWHLSGWIKGVGPDGADGTRVLVLSGLDPFTPNTLGSIGTIDSVWAYRSSDFTVPEGLDPDSLFLAFFPDGLFGNEVRTVFFDDIQLSQNVNTTIQDGSQRAPLNVRPNPATDKLWVDMQEVPVSVVANDATGRPLALQNFQHTGRTLELDVSTLASGVNVLRITTRSGSHTVRFIKA